MSTLFEVLLASMTAAIIIGIVWYVLQAVAYWNVFAKAGEPGWKSLIPFYNLYTQYKICWKPGYFWAFIVCMTIGTAMAGSASLPIYIIGICLSVIAIVISYYSVYLLSMSFGHGAGYAIGLLFLQPVFMMILGFGSSKYKRIEEA